MGLLITDKTEPAGHVSQGCVVRPSCGMCSSKCLHGEAKPAVTPVHLHLLSLYTKYPAALGGC